MFRLWYLNSKVQDNPIEQTKKEMDLQLSRFVANLLEKETT